MAAIERETGVPVIDATLVDMPHVLDMGRTTRKAVVRCGAVNT